MLGSKSTRSSYADFGQKKQSSVISRTISASRFCRGDSLVSQIDSKALKPIDRNSIDKKKPSKFVNLTESEVNRVLTMQEHMGQIEEELKWAKERLVVVENERNRALDEVKESKRAASFDSKMKVSSEAFSPKKNGELLAEIKTLKELLSNAQKELITKDKNIETLRIQVDEAKQFEIKLAERDVSFNKQKEELNNAKASEAHSTNLQSAYKRKIQDLEDEIHKSKVLEAKMLDSLASLTKQLEESKIELAESKLEIASLNVKFVSSGKSSEESGNGLKGPLAKLSNVVTAVGENESLKSELGLAKENLSRTQEDEKIAATKAKSLADEVGILKNELRLALEAEEKSNKAMDDLALALKEVATEAKHAKEKVYATQLELEHVKGEAEQLKQMIRTTEERHEKLLEEARKEAELHRNTADRLRVEAEESLLAWSGKETCFVSCIKRAEEEKTIAQLENARLAESLKAAERMTISAREESYKLRDILKQALSEANAAKAAAGIARDENSQLKDCLAEKDESLHFLTQENERLRLSEVAAYENLKEFKRLLSTTTTTSTELKPQDKEQQEGILKSPNLMVEENDEENKAKKNFSFNLDELKLLSENEDSDESNSHHEDPEKAEALKGSIFDTAADSPRSEPHTPKPPAGHHRRESSSFFTVDGETITSEELEHLETGHFDDSDSDRNHRRRKALFRRVGDLLMRKSFHRKEPSVDQ
ncbi:hypothetical protein M9H77_19676 [Catharanthus roseus]|uniref:Uncharacterized protein n=1 Tax=Catharanthus roseus TaxID=4058 RepID=A0ACC0BB38_CATRO|nr:hypothetical protein M9H77_19676 [Catharanthus roseus]